MGMTDALTDDIIGRSRGRRLANSASTPARPDLRSAAGRDVILGVGYPDYYAVADSRKAGKSADPWLGESLPAAREPSTAAFDVDTDGSASSIAPASSVGRSAANDAGPDGPSGASKRPSTKTTGSIWRHIGAPLKRASKSW